MGFIRGALLTFFCILLFLSLLAGSIFITLNLSLNYENVKTHVSSIANDFISSENKLSDEDINYASDYVKENCKNKSEFVYYSREINESIKIDCNSVNSGKNSIVDSGLENLIEISYYKKYDCDIFSCLGKSETQLFYISKQAKDYWGKLFYIFLIISIVLGTLIFFLAENKTNFPLIIGIILIISLTPLMFISWISNVSQEVYINKVLPILFSNSSLIFILGLILGIILIVLGIFLKVEFKISELFSRGDKEKEAKKKK